MQDSRVTTSAAKGRGPDAGLSERRLRGIIDIIPSVIIGIDQSGTVTDWNLSAETYTRIAAFDALGRQLYEVCPFLIQAMALVNRAIRDNSVQKIAKVAQTNSDEQRYYDILVYPLISIEYSGAVIRLDDITLKIKLEELMAQTEKMTAMGGLAAGVAHEINNPLGAILQGAQNVLRRIDPELKPNQDAAQALGISPQQIYSYLENRKIIDFIQGIQQAGERASHIISNLLQFSRRSTTNKVPADFIEIVEKSLELASADYDLKKQTDFKHIVIRREFERDVPAIFCNPIEIEQVILNLLKNAAQAMREREDGIITLRLRTLGESCELQVEDNGPGMTETVRKRIFEPFFTTKPVGEGTGLGLSVSYGIIVENHKGALRVDTTEGRGSKFTIVLPTLRAAAYVAANDRQRDVIKP